MRTALWETSAGALALLLNSKAPLHKADLFTLTLADGTVYRWSGSDVAVTGGGRTWSLGPTLKRTGVKFVVGVEVDTMTVTIYDAAGTNINGTPLIPFIRAGGLYGARLQVDKAFWGVSDTAPVGALAWFHGRVAETECGRNGAMLRVNSDLELLDVLVPRDVYSPSCLNTLYDSMCGLLAATYRVSGTATSATDTRRITFSHAMAQAAGYFDLGTIRMTSGLNNGISRSVQKHLSGSISVLQPWPFSVSNGDTYIVDPGCDKTQTTCRTKYANEPRYRGYPYVPSPETVT